MTSLQDFPVKSEPLVSIIVPAYNAARHLERCLGAVRNSSYPRCELIVVDDGSTDESPAIASEAGAQVICLSSRTGPARARNQGAGRAGGEILFFVDSDVVIREDSVARIVSTFSAHPEVDAIFGSYDDDPAEKNFLSQYKNLVHHFVHQQAESAASTFWAGCGAVRKAVFHAAGGFDDKRYATACIEDIELGYRMKSMGCGILLDKDLQATHLKKWSLRPLLYTEIFRRAVPWTQLVLKEGAVNDLNLRTSQRVSAGLVALAATLLVLSPLVPVCLIFSMVSLCVASLLNCKLIVFFFRLRGWRFAIRALAMHLFYHLYSGSTFVCCWCWYKIQTGARHLRPARQPSG